MVGKELPEQYPLAEGYRTRAYIEDYVSVWYRQYSWALGDANFYEQTAWDVWIVDAIPYIPSYHS
jgi:hypothetical protein